MKFPGGIFWRLLSIILFVAISGAILFFAYGYRYNFEEQTIQKTSIVDLQNKVANAMILFDDAALESDLPVQMKGVLPGIHSVQVTKSGFLPWNKKLLVKEDIVTIVTDILLVPENINSFIKSLATFAPDENIIRAEDFILSYIPGTDSARIISFDPKGIIKDDEIKLYKPIKNVIDVYPKEKMLVQFEDNLYSYINFWDRDFKIFMLPEGAYRMQIDGSSRNVFYLKDGNLYRKAFDRLSETNLPEEEPAILTGVTDYIINGFGRIMFIKDGSIFSSDYSGERVHLNDNQPALYTNLDIFEGFDNNAIVARTVNGNRHLISVSRSGEMFFISANLKGRPFLDKSGAILYADNDGNIFSYDFFAVKKSFIMQNKADFSLMGWIGDDQHFLIWQDNKIEIEDTDNVNHFQLLNNVGKETSIFTDAFAVYFIDGSQLMSIYWQNALTQ